MIFQCHWPAHWSLYYVGIPGSRESKEVPLGQMAWVILSVSVVIRFVQELEVWVPKCSFFLSPFCNNSAYGRTSVSLFHLLKLMS